MTPAERFTEIGLRGLVEAPTPLYVYLIVGACLYFLGSLITGISLEAWMRDFRRDTTHEQDTAVGTIGGLLWPLTISALIFYGIFLGGRGIGRSFVITYRVLVPKKIKIPKAVARKVDA